MTWVEGGVMTVGDLKQIAFVIVCTGIAGLVIAAISLLVREKGKSGVPHFTVIIISLTILSIGMWANYYTKYPEVDKNVRIRDYNDLKNGRTTWDEALKKDYTFKVDMEDMDPKTLNRDLYKYTVSDVDRTVYCDRRGQDKSGLQYILLGMPILLVLIIFISH